ncbi:VOC family protein [Nocardiopsis algeriensis]|uniref:Catechol 2,3-dioxygenase-like lactoylglutathione lyase family enzyme n=1 Tax=Nocardiopsis algeriensis TaxID=1478215 RepID=A0A841ILM2_9ACTN|nr:VOC family protein [Nocardiopsis algeriensis]MBB6119709.1 catechol 2,3-dioxygenase-like lactoylglutathione lyase family enzyme [Nocardiopsis algeriensis]
MEILSSRVLLRPTDVFRSRDFYRDVMGLAVYREFGTPEQPGTVFYLGNGLLEVSGSSEASEVPPISLWMQVRDVRAEYERLVAAGVEGLRKPEVEFWGLEEAWIADPDGVRIVLVQIPDDHPLRRDQRTF